MIAGLGSGRRGWASFRWEVLTPKAHPVVNPDPEQGMGSSLQIGLAAAAALSPAPDAVVIVLVGQSSQVGSNSNLPLVLRPSRSS